jgi:ABC-type phosphate transport system ATPase subunit
VANLLPPLQKKKSHEKNSLIFSSFCAAPGTVADNVRYGPQLRGKKLTDVEVKNLLSQSDLDPALCSRPASELSVGQAQRVALARTLANDPEVGMSMIFDCRIALSRVWHDISFQAEILLQFSGTDAYFAGLCCGMQVLLLDEPTSALDPISTQNIEEAIVRLKKTRALTTVIVSHSVKQIQRIADLVCLVVDGEVVEVLAPSELSEAKHPMARRFLELS